MPSDVPHDPFKQALSLHQQGEFDAAEALYKKLLADDSKNAEVLHLLGILMGQQGRLDEALLALTAAVNEQKDSATFHNSLGNIYRRLQQVEQANFHYQTALKLQPQSPAINNNLGILFHSQNALAEAAAYYRKAIVLKPDYADAHYNLSTILTTQEKFDESIAHLEKTLRLQPTHAQAHSHLGQLLLQQGKITEAIAHYEARLKIDPPHAESHHQLAVVFAFQDQVEQAIFHYLETLKLQPDHLEALHNLGALYVTQRKPELALGYYLKILDFKADLDAYYNIGVIYLYQDRIEDAIFFLNSALKVDPDYFNAHLNLGAAYLKKEDLKQAAHHYEAALALRPGDPEIVYILAAITQKTTPTTAPKEYIENLFDQYAPYFDKHLKDYLTYRVPDLLFTAVTQVVGTQAAQWSILDLGCGTGLCGEKFRPLAKFLKGVDLSEKMLKAASEKNVYDELQKLDIDEALRQSQALDLIIAGDVFGYTGDLTATFALVKTALKSHGLFAFTVEKMPGESYHLQNNARFAHSKKYIESLIQQHDFIIERSDNAIIRTQKEQPVQGDVWVLRRP